MISEESIEQETLIRRRTGVWLAIIGFALLVLVYLWPVLFPDQPQDLVGVGDMAWYIGPNQYFYDISIQNYGDIPLWNPLIFCGTPFAANPQVHAFYPPNLLRAMTNFDPTPLRTLLTNSWMIALHFLFGGWALFFLCRSYGFGILASLIAAAAFAFSYSAFQAAESNPVLLMTTACFAFVLFALHRLLTAEEPRQKLMWTVWSGLALGLLVLAGFPPYYACLSVALTAFCITHWLVGKNGTPQKLPRRFIGGLRRDVPHLILAIILGVMLALPLVLPGQEFASLSSRRAESELSIDRRRPVEEMEGDLTPWPLFILGRLALYVPVRGAYRPTGAGVAAAILCFLAVLHPRRRQALVYLVVFYVIQDCTIGPPFPIATLLEKLMPIQMSNPDYHGILAPAPAAMLAAFGADAVRHSAGEDKKKWCIAVLVVGLVIGVAIVHAVSAPFFVSEFDPLLDTLATPRLSLVAKIVPALFFVVMLAGFALGWMRAAYLLLPVFLIGETYAASRPLVPFPRNEITKAFSNAIEHTFTDEGEPIVVQELWQGNNRGYVSLNMNMYTLEGNVAGYDPMHLESTVRVLVPELSHNGEGTRFVGSPHIVPWSNLFLHRAFWLCRQYAVGDLPDPARLYPAVSTVFLDQPIEAPDIERVARDTLPETSLTPQAEKVKIFERSDMKPLIKEFEADPENRFMLPILLDEPIHHAATVHWRVQEPFTAFVSLMNEDNGELWFLGDFLIEPVDGVGSLEVPLPTWENAVLILNALPDAREELARLLRIEVYRDPSDENGNIEVLHRTANAVSVRAECTGPRILLFTDAFYPGWEARVDGESAEIFAANSAFKAVALEEGVHTIEFTYSPRRVRAGVASAGAAVVISIVLLASSVKRKGARKPAAQGEGVSDAPEQN